MVESDESFSVFFRAHGSALAFKASCLGDGGDWRPSSLFVGRLCIFIFIYIHTYILGGGFKYFLFFPLFREDSHFD